MQLPKIPFVTLDTETTGFIPKVNRVIEYAHVVYRNGEKTDEYEELVSIPSEIPGIVQVITRIRPDALEGKKTFDVLRPEIEKAIGEDTLIVGQNILFDISMLKGEGIDLSDRPWIDTSMLASLVFPELESYSLGYISTVLELDHSPVHRALGDVRATVELLSKCWERLLELPQDMVMDLKATMSKSSKGYQMLFNALPTSDNTQRPTWMQMPTPKHIERSDHKIALRKPDIGVVDMVEESLEPHSLQAIIDSAAADTSTTHFIAVKNLTAMAKRLHLPNGVRVLHPPFTLLDANALAALQQQQTFSEDEATLLTKIDWFTPTVSSDIAIHGDEKAVWNGKLACTEQSKAYVDQFEDLPSVILLDHRQLLAFVKDPDHAGHGVLNEKVHIIIDDASMLEDTASKAYGALCSIRDLRGAAKGHDSLTKFTDLLALWIEKTRNEQDIRFLAQNDLDSPEVEALNKQINVLLADESLLLQTKYHIESAKMCLSLEALTRITWIESRQDANAYLHSVPESVAELLQKDLFEKYSVSLLIPPRSSELLQEAVHRNVKKAINTQATRVQDGVDVSFVSDVRGSTIVADPPDGKTILLAGSRRVIEEYFIKYTEDLEDRDITLICQGLSGGQKRMQAEFLAAKSPAIWVLTPWTFEGIELPPSTVNHLIIDALPFDNPSQPVFGKRAEHFDNAFTGYSMPRLLHRLFRILRTFKRLATEDADVTVIDNRITEKRYGKTIQQYMELISQKVSEEKFSNTNSVTDFPENWQMNLF